MGKDCIVLIIDDPAWAEGMQAALKEFVGEMIVCNRVEDVPKKHLDLILYEPVADKMSDVIYTELKKYHSETPIVCYTTIQNIKVFLETSDMRFDGIILKPVNVEDFKEVCCNYLKRCMEVEYYPLLCYKDKE